MTKEVAEYLYDPPRYQNQLSSQGQQGGPTVWTGTLIGPHGQRVGRYVSYEDYHNLNNEVLRLRG